MKNTIIIRLAALGLSLLVASSVFGASQASKAFQKIDADGNGTLSAKEIDANSLSMLEANGKKNGWDKAEVAKRGEGVAKRTATRIKKGDKNGDGQLSPEEWEASAPGNNKSDAGAKGKGAAAEKGKGKKK
jgi:hypothetical protein